MFVRMDSFTEIELSTSAKVNTFWQLLQLFVYIDILLLEVRISMNIAVQVSFIRSACFS